MNEGQPGKKDESSRFVQLRVGRQGPDVHGYQNHVRKNKKPKFRMFLEFVPSFKEKI
jgi:hypothetical protein